MRLLIAVILSTCLGASACLADTALKRVVLSTGGVGYYEYEAEVDGAGSVGLDVPIGQVDDLLMSLVVFDPAGGVANVTLPGRDDTVQAFGDAPFGPAALDSPIALLNALRGVEVTVQGSRPMTGRLMNAEEEQETNGQVSQKRTRVTLLGAEGLQQFVLEDAGSVQIANPVLRAQVDRALEAIRAQARQAVRHVTIHLTGGGKRTVDIGYVAGAPLWKATYRLVLDPGSTAHLQGWATLENQSGADWKGVALTLQYGNPVAFRQALYRSYFVQRPEVPVEILGHVLPDIDTRARAMQAFAEPAAAPPPAPAPVGMAAPKLAPALAAAPATSVAETGDETVFTLPQPIELQAGHSLNVAIFDSTQAAPRVGLVPFRATHPLTSVRLKADSAHSLPAGVITVYDTVANETGFAGDARLGGVPAGETRLVSFAQDLRTTVETKQSPRPDIATAVTVANGVMTYTVRSRQAIEITMTGPAQESRNLLLELPRGGLGQTLTFADGKTKATEETATAYRVAVALAPGETRTLTAFLDQPVSRTVALIDGDESVLAFVCNQDTLNPAARTALRHVLELRQAAARQAAGVKALQAQMDDVLADQDRLRKNLAVVTAGDALRTRLVQALDASETRAETLRKAIASAETDAAKARQAVADAVGALKI
ncbi:MAG TPA: hypothetical protein VHB27_05825 [Rhodopila sp.]|uniref:hypothetical protein n=1 Tax=Rhodopila sp. TaxID=2480087 RepID=UPI002C5B24A3|nr:hypothetical protein [Rhodopila sp.]HVY14723.1 hypothetical protein [Rhodopila sp.]